MLLLAFVAVSSINGFGLFDRVNNAVTSYNGSVHNEEDAVNKAFGILDNITGENSDNGGNGGISYPGGDDTKVSEIKEGDIISPDTGNISNSMGVVEIAWLAMDNTVIPNPLAPKVTADMTPIKWDGTNWVTADVNNAGNDWYNYQAQIGKTDGHTSNWANAKTNTDQSYWVWIPRYAYKIIYFDGVNAVAHANHYREFGKTNGFDESWISGYSTIYGMIDKENKVVANTKPNINPTDMVQTDGYKDYIPHPAFLGTGYNDLGGGFGTDSKGISGFWVAKFEMSMETSGSPTNPTTTTAGDILTSGTVKAVSKPNVASWRYITIGKIYTNALGYDTAKKSHLMKNSEWGAVAYLTHSRYGRNGIEITINDNSSYYTGGGTGDAYKTNVNQSSTGNITGIYDLSGGSYEYVAAFNKLGSTTYLPNGSSFASTGGSSTEYATAYSNSTTTYNATNFSDFYTNGKDVSHTGDAIHEVWVNGTSGWFSDCAIFVSSDDPFFGRGRYLRQWHERWGFLCVLQQSAMPAASIRSA